MPAGISHGEAIFHTRSVFHKSRKGFISLKKAKSKFDLAFFWWAIRDLNPGPAGYEPAALTTELMARG